MKITDIEELKKKATEIRIGIIEGVYGAKSGHPGGSLSCADILTVLYFNQMNIDPMKSKDEARDRFVLSKGHAAPALYSTLAHRGFFNIEELKNLRRLDSNLSGHPDMKKVPGVDASTGSLGQGLACGVGMALCAKLDEKDYRVFVVVGDGEAQEGGIWEAAQTANKYKLDNLIVFVDNNNLQLDGTCDEVMPNIDLGKKFEAFGFENYEIDGHDMQQIVDTLDKIRASKNGKPKCIFAHTIKGKGVSYMENECGWHGVAPNEQEYKQAMEELDAQML